MYLLRPLLKLLVGIRPDNQKYLPVHTERRTYQQFTYPFRYFFLAAVMLKASVSSSLSSFVSPSSIQ